MKTKIQKLLERLMELVNGAAGPALVGVLIAMQAAGPLALAAVAPDRLTQKPRAVIGAGVAQDSDLTMDVGAGASNPGLKYKSSDNSLNLNRAVTKFGSGAAADQQFIADIGAGASNPRLKWNNGATRWEFSADGSTFKAFGSGSGGGGGINLLTGDDNNAFEDCSGSSCPGWTASGGTVGTETSAPLFGDKSALWDASALSQTFSSTAKTVKEGLKGQSCLAMISYQFTGSSGDYKLQAYDGTTVLKEESLNPAVSPDVGVGYVGFQCPTSGTVQLRLIAGVSNPGQIKIDGPSLAAGAAHIGSNIMLAQVANAEFYGSVETAATASCAFVRTQATYGSFPADTDCPVATATGKASAPGTKIPAVTFASLPKGEYMFLASGLFGTNGSPNDYSRWRFHDGTNALVGETKVQTTSSNGFMGSQQVTGYLTNPSDRSNVTVELQCLISNAGQNCYAEATNNTFSITVVKLPTTAQTVISGVDASAQTHSAKVTGCYFTTTSGTYVDGTLNNTCTLTQRNSQSFGAVTLFGSGSGVTFTPKRLGTVEVCADTPVYQSAAGQTTEIQLIDESSNIIGYGSQFGSVAGVQNSITVCGHMPVASLSAKTAKLQIKVTGGTGQFGSMGDVSIGWRLVSISETKPQPFFAIKSVSSDGNNERIERALIAGDGSCTITTQSGAWLASAVHNSVGDCTLTINSGMFSSRPICNVTVEATNATLNAGMTKISTTSAPSATLIRFTTANTSGTLTDYGASVLCMGPK